MVLLDDHLLALLDLGQYRVKVACKFGFRDADYAHASDDTCFFWGNRAWLWTSGLDAPAQLLIKSAKDLTVAYAASK